MRWGQQWIPNMKVVNFTYVICHADFLPSEETHSLAPSSHGDYGKALVYEVWGGCKTTPSMIENIRSLKTFIAKKWTEIKHEPHKTHKMQNEKYIGWGKIQQSSCNRIHEPH